MKLFQQNRPRCLVGEIDVDWQLDQFLAGLGSKGIPGLEKLRTIFPPESRIIADTTQGQPLARCPRNSTRFAPNRLSTAVFNATVRAVYIQK